jgi:hypothetical protein
MNFQFLDLDIYSKRIGLYYRNKDKIATPFGMILTMIYVIISLGLFITYTTNIINHKTLNVHDSLIYPGKAPSIELDKNIFYFAFGVESPIDKTRFIDTTIYYPRAHFFYKVKEGSNLKTIYDEELKIERCDEMKFGKEYQELLVKGELNNSYCLNDVNFTLTGGAKYDKISYIVISIFPCINSTENENHCKAKEIIEEQLSGAYFSFITKDVGLNPSNYSNPIVPIFQDFFTTIDKAFFRDYILYFGITEMQTDEGIIFEKMKTQKVLQIRREAKAFYFREEAKFYNGGSMCDIQFRLADDIRVQKRSYDKISGVFSTTGGYMQLISTIFTIITFLTNKLGYEMKLANSLFNFYPKERKISVKSEFNNMLESLKNDSKIKFNSVINNNLHKTSTLVNFKNSLFIKNNKKSENDISEAQEKNNSISKEQLNNIYSSKINNSKILKLNNNFQKNINNKPDLKTKLFEDNKSSNNRSKISLLPLNIDTFSSHMCNRFNIIKKSKNKQDNYVIEKRIFIPDDYISKNININMCIYFCFSKCKKDKINIKLFNDGISFYRQKMDIIHLFNIVLLFELLSLKQKYQISNK